MVHFVGAGCGADDLITVRGMRLIKKADVIIYAGSLVNKSLLDYAKPECSVYNSAIMTLGEVIDVMYESQKVHADVVRLHTGEPSLYGAIREQMDALDEKGIIYDSTPGVSACFGASAAVNMEYTLPGISQSLIITRMAGRTEVPAGESIESFAAHGCSMAIYLSAGMLEELSERLIAGGYTKDTPAILAFRVSWEDEKICRCTVGSLKETGENNNITKTATVLVGEAIRQSGYEHSRLYADDFSTGYRKAKKNTDL